MGCSNSAYTDGIHAEAQAQREHEEQMRLMTVQVFAYLGQRSYDNAIAKGFWSGQQRNERNAGEAIALMHSELSEALEALRQNDPPSQKIQGYSQAEEEFADTIIRMLDYAQGCHMNVAGAVFAKMTANENRPYKHGKEF